eukprot:1191476-Prorocentrum_minimum.AAC.5
MPKNRTRTTEHLRKLYNGLKTSPIPKSKCRYVVWPMHRNMWNSRVSNPVTNKQKCGTYLSQVDAAIYRFSSLYQTA